MSQIIVIQSKYNHNFFPFWGKYKNLIKGGDTRFIPQMFKEKICLNLKGLRETFSSNFWIQDPK